MERANSSNNILKLTASKDELAQLEQALKQSEQHREADKKWFIEQLKELGKVISTPSDWTPLKNYKPPFPGYTKPDFDRKDPWQFKNFLVKDGE